MYCLVFLFFFVSRFYIPRLHFKFINIVFGFVFYGLCLPTHSLTCECLLTSPILTRKYCWKSALWFPLTRKYPELDFAV